MLEHESTDIRADANSAPLGVALVDPSHRVVHANTTLCQMLRRTPAELIGMRFEEFTHPDDVDLDAHLATRLFAGELDSYEIEKRCLDKDSRIVPIHLTASVVRDRSGKSVYGVAIVRQRPGPTQRLTQAIARSAADSDVDRIRHAILDD